MIYNIISTGSHGNAVILNDNILIDCGVPFKSISGIRKHLDVVLLTHIHSDHFCKRAIKRLAMERPTLRFACCEWLADKLKECEVHNIDVMQVGKTYDYGKFQVSPIQLYHDVENCGWRVFAGNEKAIYMTDTVTLDGIAAKDYDLYLVEANYTESEMQERILEKQQSGAYIYENRVLRTHLSKEKCDAWLIDNMGENSEFVYLHQHNERSERNERNERKE